MIRLLGILLLVWHLIQPLLAFTDNASRGMEARWKAAQEACSQLAQHNPDLTLFPNSTEYIAELQDYWVFQNGDLRPSCRFTPATPADVSVFLRTVTTTRTPFALSSGKHGVALGASNVGPAGITLDLHRHMRNVTLDPARALVRVQPGAKWGDVYAFLEPRGWMVVGGRLSDIGAGGLLLGAGISHYSPGRGWASDNVLALTAVLADGAVVRAAPGSPHEELFWALRGGGNRFGVAVEFELAAFPYEAPLFAGAVPLEGGAEVVAEATRRLVEFNGAGSLLDNAASATMPFAWSAAAPRARTALAFLADSNGRDFTANASHPLYPLLAVGSSAAGLAPVNVSTLSVSLFAGTPASRYAQSVMTLESDAAALSAAVDAFEAALQPLFAADPALQAQAMYQPLPASMVRRTEDSPVRLAGGGPAFVVFISLVWTDPARDGFYAAKLREVHGVVEAAVEARGALRRWKYWNYAAGWQTVYRDYGAEVYARLRRVVERYDPDRVFWELQSRSFDYL